MKKLQLMHIYLSKNNHIIIPTYFNNYNFCCKVFWCKNNEILDQGYYEYNKFGECLDATILNKDVFSIIATKNLPENIKNAVLEWKHLLKLAKNGRSFI